jgi:outer membrane protein, heavy metal efflux system
MRAHFSFSLALLAASARSAWADPPEPAVTAAIPQPSAPPAAPETRPTPIIPLFSGQATPHPNPPSQGGREKKGQHRRVRLQSAEPPAESRPTRDAPVRRAQAGAADIPALPETSLPTNPIAAEAAGTPLGLQAALYGALTSNPDLVAMRQGTPIAASAEAVEVARRFPTTLNPTVWIDYRPITLIPPAPFGSGSPAGGGAGGTAPPAGHHGFYHYGQNYILVSLRQPVELGHQTTHRYAIAKAAFDQQRWNVVQAEMTTLVQTYRFFQTAAYRRERLRVARQLADFNDRLVQTLQRRLEANQVPAADVALARVESRAARQQVKAAQQDYVTALTDLRNQIGIPETAGAAVPLGGFTLPPYLPPIDENAMIQTALQNRPDIHAALAQLTGTCSAVQLAKGDRIPTPVIGPQYAMDEAGIQYIGLILVSPIPILNNNTPLVRQREAEYRRAVVALQQAQQRAITQVRAAVAKWNGARELVNDTIGLTEELSKEVTNLERLFEAGQTDLTKLMQARQRLIQLENSRLDAVWAATQAQADLLTVLGAPTLIAALQPPNPGANPACPAPATAAALAPDQPR